MNFKSESFRCEQEAPLERVLKEHFVGASWNEVRRLVDTGKIQVDGQLLTDKRRVIAAGSSVALSMTAPRKAAQGPSHEQNILFVDPHLVVVNKPAGLAAVDHEQESTSLQSELLTTLERMERRSLAPLLVVHRIDKVTSGVMLFARTREVQLALKEQFRAHTTGRHYTALAHGEVRPGTVRFRLVRDRGDGIRGVAQAANQGREAVTHITVIEPLARCTLIQCRLETGRTHQIRIHLAATGHPLVGDAVYTRGYVGTLISSPRTLLHAAYLSFAHPVLGQQKDFSAPLPQAFREILERERNR
ncbi:MAG TPA: RluA family pseudouridine synthase [Polyangiaceae bacterium]|nr:RluA family pseudouridine synthase [Polyangiaceae bacterium]